MRAWYVSRTLTPTKAAPTVDGNLDEEAWTTLVDVQTPADGRLSAPVDLAVTPGGELVVSDQRLGVVVRYRPSSAAD